MVPSSWGACACDLVHAAIRNTIGVVNSLLLCLLDECPKGGVQFSVVGVKGLGQQQSITKVCGMTLRPPHTQGKKEHKLVSTECVVKGWL